VALCPLDINEQYDKIYRYCFLRVRHKETAEDLTQETFLRYLEHPQYHSEDKTLQLLYTIAGNLCTDEFRKIKLSELSETASDGKDMEDNILSDVQLKQVFDSLSDEDREIVLLRFVNEVPVNVIAKLYNISRFALNRRLNRILGSLREHLGKEELI
jgi:RNA polymerase sigma-70 factor (ECF subfamily)